MKHDSAPETREHIRQVAERLKNVCTELRDRGYFHDASKLRTDEKPIFDEVTPKLKGLTYGTDEYRASLKELGPALAHHYRNNSHHPEHYADGVAGMDLLDLIEMYCDWAAATLRTKDGDMSKGLAINAARFKLDPQLASILRNTWERHGGFTGYEGYRLPANADEWTRANGPWTPEIDMGTGATYVRRPKPNAPIAPKQSETEAVIAAQLAI